MKRFHIPALLICLALPVAAAAQVAPPPRTISVTATATVEAAPDMAVLTIGVTHEAKAAGAAMDQVSGSVRDILTRLDEAGIASRDVQTSGFSLSPVWSSYDGSAGSQRRITGYQASNGVTVRVRALETLGGVLDKVIADGANQLGGIQFGLQDPEPLMNEARRKAVQDARARAELLSDAAGVTLGPLRTLSEHSDRARPMQMDMMAMSRSADVPVSAGEIGLSATVSMEFEIAE